MGKKLSRIGRIGAIIFIVLALIIGALWSPASRIMKIVADSHTGKATYWFLEGSPRWYTFEKGDTVFGDAILLSNNDYYDSNTLIIDSPCRGVVRTSNGGVCPSNMQIAECIRLGCLVDPRYDHKESYPKLSNEEVPLILRMHLYQAYIQMAFQGCSKLQPGHDREIDVSEILSKYYSRSINDYDGFCTYATLNGGVGRYFYEKTNESMFSALREEAGARYPFAKGDTVVGDIVFDDGSDTGLYYEYVFVESSPFSGTVTNGFIEPSSDLDLDRFLGYKAKSIDPRIDKPEINTSPRFY